ncbi:MAG: HAMP domain-containing histidine kinase [Dehalococcoidia bacterium]|nr:HAMP domain-containing histidine kinase [Dehalococcoidia bacterium]
MLVFGIAFVVALNVAARLDRPNLVQPVGVEFQMVQTSGPGGTWRTISQPRVTWRDVEDSLYSQNLDQLRNWSIFAVVGLALASGIGGYVLSGMMLQPVRDITDAASTISATNLSRRINHQGADDEMKALADTFDRMIERLEHSFEQQRQFVQDASHELRTPLAAIRTNIEVAEMDPQLSDDEYRDLLALIKSQTERLTRLSEDLLLLSASERDGRAEFEPVNLVSLAHDVSRQLTPLAHGRQMVLRVEGDPDVEAQADPDALFRCLFNLVDNAIKYSGDGRLVTISVQREPAWATVSVTDNGPGISAEQQASIFERFYRVDAGRSRREGGTGLGLAIVRELVQTMNGTVSVESTPGAGATFRLRLAPAPVAAPLLV